MSQLSVVDTNKDQFACQSFTLLIVEDSPLLLALLEDFFAYCQFNSVFFKSALEALEYIEQGNHIDILIADYKLPGNINGIDLSLSVQKRLKNLKTIIMTGFDRELILEKEHDKQFIVLRKPFDLFDLKKLIEEMIQAG